jgi:hypothetical protein
LPYFHCKRDIQGKSVYSLQNHEKVPFYFGWGDRKLNIIHSRLRNMCISLNADLYLVNLNYTNKFYNMIYLDGNNKVNIKENKVQ